MTNIVLAVKNETERSFFVSSEILNSFEEFATFIHPLKDGIVDFIQLAYHKESPFVKNIENISDRLLSSLKYSGLNADSAEAIHLVSVGKDIVATGLVTEENNIVLKMIDTMISCYLSRIQHSNDFEMYITLQTLFWEYTERLRTKVSVLLDEDKALKAMDTKVKITDPCLNLIGTIEGLRSKIFGLNEKAAKKADEKIKVMKPTADNWAKK